MNMNHKHKLIKFSRILLARKISEPLNSLLFILLKVYNYELIYFKYFKTTKLRTLLKSTIKRSHYTKFLQLFLKRLNHFPIQYMIGKWYFRKIIVDCERPVLIPRIETEKIVELAHKLCQHVQQKKRINHNKNYKENSEDDFNIKFMEIGVGTGAIFISIIKEYFNSNTNSKIERNLSKGEIKFVGIDIEPKCIELSKRNVDKILMNAHKSKENSINPEISYNTINYPNFKIDLINCDFNEYLPNTTDENEKFDFIVSNPPYIKTSANNVMLDVSKHESKIALFSGEDGLHLIKNIICKSRDLVRVGGFVILEIDPEQMNQLIDIMIRNNFKYFYFEKDLFGRDRFLIYHV